MRRAAAGNLDAVCAGADRREAAVMNRSTVAHSLVLAAGLALALPNLAEARGGGGGGGGMGGFHGGGGGGMGGFHGGATGGFHVRGGGVAFAPRVAVVSRATRGFRHAANQRSGAFILPLGGIASAWGYDAPGYPLWLDTPVRPLTGTAVPLVVQPMVQPSPIPEVWRRDGDTWRLVSASR
jgi:hypothetical protein